MNNVCTPGNHTATAHFSMMMQGVTINYKQIFTYNYFCILKLISLFILFTMN